MLQTQQSHLKHVAIIMDGNGRWAQGRNHRRVWGHVRGAKIVSQIVEEADDLGIKSLTLFTFSTENWARPVSEIKTLFSLLKKFIQVERKRIIENNILFRVLGDISKVPLETQDLIRKLEADTKNNKGLKLNFAFDYGARAEITASVNCFIKTNPGKEITELDISNNLLLPDAGDVDLLIRTGGDQRISNFLLWQLAYAELYFSESKWPDFSRKEFREIIKDTSTRERRFGSISSCESLDNSKIIAKENVEFFTNQTS